MRSPETGSGKMTRLIDTHAHYDDEKFDGLRDELIGSLLGGGTELIINAGTNLDTCRSSVALAAKYDGIYAACGIHPEDCGKYGDMEFVLSELKAMLGHPKVVALGEIGLDNHWEDPPADVQKKWFYALLSLASELEIPVIIHDREAHGACMDAVKEFKGVKGVFHSFSGSAEMAKELVKLGFYVSFSGTVTFKNASRVLESASAVPLDRLLIETDCPYLAPHPFRGKLNHSGYMTYTAQKLAEIKGVPYDELCCAVNENARRLFRL